MKITTRFAPSPTGLLHAGNYRTALFSYIFARQNGGSFVLRIEDTDRERSRKEYEDNIVGSLKWLGLSYDALPDGRPFERQSERVEAHRKYLQQLIDKGAAYISREEKDGVTKDLVRFKNPGTKVTFKDLIRGEITMDTTDLKDFVIAKNINEPLFHLAVVADDFDMGITHVIRGEDHISNTPRQILIQRALGAPEPVYAHLPLVLAPDRTKLSKRKGALAITDYRDKGFLPETLINYMALLGWNPGTEQEIISLEKLVKLFNIEKIQKGGAIFNEEKLRWINKEYMKLLPTGIIEEKLAEAIPAAWKNSDKAATIIKALAPSTLERIETFGDIQKLVAEGELTYFFEWPEYDGKLLVPKKDSSEGITVGHLKKAAELLSAVEEKNWNAEGVKAAIWDYATESGRGAVLWPLRLALSGKEKSPDPFTLAAILGKHETVARINGGIQKLSGQVV